MSDGVIVYVSGVMVLLDTRLIGISKLETYATSANVDESEAGVNAGTVRETNGVDVPNTVPAISPPDILICHVPPVMDEVAFNEIVIWSKFVIVVLAPVGLAGLKVKFIWGVLLAADCDRNGMFIPFV
jgi:hypothetical protein